MSFPLFDCPFPKPEFNSHRGQESTEGPPGTPTDSGISGTCALRAENGPHGPSEGLSGCPFRSSTVLSQSRSSTATADRKARKDHQEPLQTPELVAHARFGPSMGHT